MAFEHREPSLAWVCTTCLIAQEGEPIGGEDMSHAWALVPADIPITMGMMASEHPCGAPNDDDPCDCEEITFSRSRCDGCGTYDAGTRHAFTVWYPKTEGL